MFLSSLALMAISQWIFLDSAKCPFTRSVIWNTTPSSKSQEYKTFLVKWFVSEVQEWGCFSSQHLSEATHEHWPVFAESLWASWKRSYMSITSMNYRKWIGCNTHYQCGIWWCLEVSLVFVDAKHKPNLEDYHHYPTKCGDSCEKRCSTIHTESTVWVNNTTCRGD